MNTIGKNMSLSFKQFSKFIDETSAGKSPEQVDEIFGKFFGKKKDEKNDNDVTDDKNADDKNADDKNADDESDDPQKSAATKKQDVIQRKKDAEDERRKEQKKLADERWAEAKKNAEASKSSKSYDRDDYALHRNRR